jgi:hypothetical protein
MILAIFVLICIELLETGRHGKRLSLEYLNIRFPFPSPTQLRFAKEAYENAKKRNLMALSGFCLPHPRKMQVGSHCTV